MIPAAPVSEQPSGYGSSGCAGNSARKRARAHPFASETNLRRSCRGFQSARRGSGRGFGYCPGASHGASAPRSAGRAGKAQLRALLHGGACAHRRGTGGGSRSRGAACRSCARWGRGWRQVPLPCAVADTAEATAAEPAPAPAVAAARKPQPRRCQRITRTMRPGGMAPPSVPSMSLRARLSRRTRRPAPASAEKVASFDELAAASKAQVEHVAADLGVGVAHPGTPVQAEAVEAPGERRLESRSSEGVEPSSGVRGASRRCRRDRSGASRSGSCA